MVTAKFKVIEIAQMPGWQKEHPVLTRVKLTAIQGEPFGSATPSATCEMVIANDHAAKQFHLGKIYFVTFSEDTGNGE